METPTEERPEDMVEFVIEETKRRQDSYYDIALPGEEDGPIGRLTFRLAIPAIVWMIVLIALWLIGRWVVLPIYYG
jgi:hypothetical protein